MEWNPLIAGFGGQLIALLQNVTLDIQGKRYALVVKCNRSTKWWATIGRMTMHDKHNSSQAY